MKKRLLLIVAIIIVALIIFLPIWRFVPRDFSKIISFNENSISGFSVHGMVNHFDADETDIDMYRLNDIEKEDIFKEAMNILKESTYRQDFRNLLPWRVKSIGSGKGFDGRTVMVSFFTGNKKDEYVQIQFMSGSVVTVSVGGKDGLRIYHPTSQKTIDQLVEFLQTYDIK